MTKKKNVWWWGKRSEQVETVQTVIFYEYYSRMAQVDCPAECGWHWATTYFGDCVCGDRDIVSFVLGLTSIAAGTTVALPQIWENFRNGKSEGISFALIVTWITARVTVFSSFIITLGGEWERGGHGENAFARSVERAPRAAIRTHTASHLPLNVPDSLENPHLTAAGRSLHAPPPRLLAFIIRRPSDVSMENVESTKGAED